jgi:hypothetical protein
MQHGASYSEFYSLDYVKTEEQALQHSTQWARSWVDARG